jgi:hypothetical protein
MVQQLNISFYNRVQRTGIFLDKKEVGAGKQNGEPGWVGSGNGCLRLVKMAMGPDPRSPQEIPLGLIWKKGEAHPGMKNHSKRTKWLFKLFPYEFSILKKVMYLKRIWVSKLALRGRGW